MENTLSILAFMALAFAVSVAAGYLLGWGTKQVKLARSPIPLGSALLLIAPSGTSYKARLIRQEGQNWLVSAPVLKGAFVPFRIDEHLLIEAPSSLGVHRFQGRVVSRDEDTKNFTIAAISEPNVIERRTDPRQAFENPISVLVNGDQGELLNLSAGGGLLIAKTEVAAGDTVSVYIPKLDKTLDGWVLESTATPWGVYRAQEIRVAWQEALDDSSDV